MGYTSRFEGHIKVEPNLTLLDVQELNDFHDRSHPEDGTFPGMWCQWIPHKSGVVVPESWEPGHEKALATWRTLPYDSIAWDGGEKFYDSAQWMSFIIQEFLQDYTCNGQIFVQGQTPEDRWFIIVINNEVFVKEAKILPAGRARKVEW